MKAGEKVAFAGDPAGKSSPLVWSMMESGKITFPTVMVMLYILIRVLLRAPSLKRSGKDMVISYELFLIFYRSFECRK